MLFGENSVEVRREECHCGTKMRSDRSFPAIHPYIGLNLGAQLDSYTTERLPEQRKQLGHEWTRAIGRPDRGDIRSNSENTAFF